MTRRLAAHWPQGEGGCNFQPIVYDYDAKKWRTINKRETQYLVFDEKRKPGVKQEEPPVRWWQQMLGRFSQKSAPIMKEPDSDASGFLCPELFAGGDLRQQTFRSLRSGHGLGWPMMAVFYDMIAVDMPDKIPKHIVTSYREYLESLLQFDIIAAISEDSRNRLVRYWKGNGVVHLPEILAVPLGVDSVAGAEVLTQSSRQAPMVLSVGTLEGRKNHASLLDACERLWLRGFHFRLKLIGMLNQETGAEAAKKITKLKDAGHPVEWTSNAGDRELFAAYQECDFTVYPSLYEGFGLPVLESLAHGRACICSGQNAMAEIVSDGGCVAVGEPTAENLERGMADLLANRDKAVALSRGALARKIRTWDEYAHEICILAQTACRASSH